jgi:hypothetical protein
LRTRLVGEGLLRRTPEKLLRVFSQLIIGLHADLHGYHARIASGSLIGQGVVMRKHTGKREVNCFEIRRRGGREKLPAGLLRQVLQRGGVHRPDPDGKEGHPVDPRTGDDVREGVDGIAILPIRHDNHRPPLAGPLRGMLQRGHQGIV